MLMKSFGLQSPIGKKTRTAYILAPKFGQYTKEHGGRYTRERCIEARVSMLILFHELEEGSSVELLDATTDGRPWVHWDCNFLQNHSFVMTDSTLPNHNRQNGHSQYGAKFDVPFRWHGESVHAEKQTTRSVLWLLDESNTNWLELSP